MGGVTRSPLDSSQMNQHSRVSPLPTIAMWLRDFCGTLALQARISGRLCNGRPANMLLKISNLRSAKLEAPLRLSGSLDLRTR